MKTEDLYSAKIFLNAVLPLFKETALRTPQGRGFSGKSGIIQVSVKAEGELWGTHFILEKGEMTTRLGLSESKPDVELAFPSIDAFNAFFKGVSKRMPRIRGFTRPALLVATFSTLLKMAALLGMKTPPKAKDQKELLVRLYFYLLSSGISQLNKLGHPEISDWARKSPDRVYAWSVDGHPELGAYIRVKAGNSKACRGPYTRSKPFYTMRFADTDSALGILLETEDLLKMTAEKKLIMEGAPEYGAKIGDFMMIVGSLAKAAPR